MYLVVKVRGQAGTYYLLYSPDIQEILTSLSGLVHEERGKGQFLTCGRCSCPVPLVSWLLHVHGT